MNGTTARALLEDAFQQVVDNRIFRLLLVVVCVIVAVFFVVGFRADGVSVLFGWRKIDYESLFGVVGANASSVSDPRGLLISGVESLVIEQLAGNIAMIFCISATAFFVPRMLEKGSADILFSKPLSRTTLFLSRYVAGLIFVALLASGLLLGIWLGLALVSGWNDPGILWGVVTLVYLYAIIQPFSMLIGVLTRSTVAAILLSLLFFMGSGCMHRSWRLLEFGQEASVVRRANNELARADAAEDGAALPELKESRSGSGVLDAIGTFIEVVHYTLPKTMDADILTRRLRRAIAGGELTLVDEEGQLSVQRALDGVELLAPERSQARGEEIMADLDSEPARWEHRAKDGTVRARVTLRRASRAPLTAASPDGGKRPRRLNLSTASDLVAARITASGRASGDVERVRDEVAGVNAEFLLWNGPDGDDLPAHASVVLTSGEWWYEFEFDAEPDLLAANLSSSSTAPSGRAAWFLDRVRFGRGLDEYDPGAWYEKRFGWTSPWRYNAFFSIGSSLAFVLVMLALAGWKLGRIDL